LWMQRYVKKIFVQKILFLMSNYSVTMSNIKGRHLSGMFA